MNYKQILVIAIIAMFLLVPFASAKQDVEATKVSEKDKDIGKITDRTKESPKEIKNKEPDIVTGKQIRILEIGRAHV